ncbi:DinB family protein [Tamlana haliotis]|uniref:DinB family protein n=1 Tax=Pseudotamlana haliotis TaxID=2614804 RepID=A0A6N6MDC3_9FLAO|nr:DinB family protein [Tamlana haliotis]KAB1068685.1 DinB family protein [Tamlana haliotis]
MKVSILEPKEYHSYYKTYIDKVPEHISLLEGLEKGNLDVISFFESIPEAKLNYSYAEGKWTIKEVFQHMVDTERVLYYRCFTIARGDKSALPGFEQDDYVSASKANAKSITDLVTEYLAVRNNTITLIKSLDNSDFTCIGTVSGGAMSARATAFIIVGHELHHLEVLERLYF